MELFLSQIILFSCVGFVGLALGLAWELICGKEIQRLLDFCLSPRDEVNPNKLKLLAREIFHPNIIRGFQLHKYISTLAMQFLCLLCLTFSLWSLLDFTFNNPFSTLLQQTSFRNNSQIFPWTVLCEVEHRSFTGKSVTFTVICEIFSSVKNQFAHEMVLIMLLSSTLFYTFNLLRVPYELNVIKKKNPNLTWNQAFYLKLLGQNMTWVMYDKLTQEFETLIVQEVP